MFKNTVQNLDNSAKLKKPSSFHTCNNLYNTSLVMHSRVIAIFQNLSTDYFTSSPDLKNKHLAL